MRVLIVGDSISLFRFSHSPTCSGYGQTLVALVKKHNISFDHYGGWYLPHGQCGNTETVFNRLIQDMKTANKYDHVYWNAGLHDVKEDHEHVDINVYASNVVKISEVFRVFYGAGVTFGSTISIAANNTRHNPIVAYNQLVRHHLPKHVSFHDQHNIITSRCGHAYITCDIHCKDGVHLSSLGDRFLGTHVFQHIMKQLEPRIRLDKDGARMGLG